MSPRTPEQNKKIRAQKTEIILDAALHVFAEEGYHSATVSRIAKVAGVSKGLMYNYFESKEEVLKTLVYQMADQMMERFPIPEGDPGDELIERYIDLSFDVIEEDKVKSKLFFSMYLQPEVMALVTDKMMERAIPFMEIMMKYFTKRGVKDPVSMMRYFSAAIDGVQMHILMSPKEHPYPTEMARKYLKQQFIHSDLSHF